MTNKKDEGEDPDDDIGAMIPDFVPFSDLRKFDFPPDEPLGRLGRTFRDGVAKADETNGRDVAKVVGLLGLGAIILGFLRGRQDG